MSLLETFRQRITPLNQQAMALAQARQNQLTKPPGSLGQLEQVSIQLAGITGTLRPKLTPKHIVIMAGDHGVTAEGVSAYPSEVTAQMIHNFLAGGAAISVLAQQMNASLLVVDMGVAAEIETKDPRFLSRKLAQGTQNMALGPAMSLALAQESLEIGITVVNYLVDTVALNILITGEMGIGNTTAAAAIASIFTQRPPAELAGPGTGLDEAGVQHKITIIEKALQINQPNPQYPLAVLAKVGGFEIGGIAGLIIGAAAHCIPVVVDGFIATAGAIIATALAPQAKDYIFAGHQSAELGHQALLNLMALTPLLKLDLRLGEGTGATLALPLLDASVRLLNEMATFVEAGVLAG